MKKFLVLYHAPADAMAQTANASPEEQQKGMEQWMQWAHKAGSALTDLGAPLFNGQQVKPGGASAASSKEVAGYSIVQAESIEAAKALFDGHPHISGWHPGASVEIHEVMPLPGM